MQKFWNPGSFRSFVRGLESRLLHSIVCLVIAATVIGGRMPSHAAANEPDAAYQPTRFVAQLAKPAGIRTFTLKNPDRVVVELPEMGIGLPDVNQLPKTGLVRTFRYGRFGSGKARLILETRAPVDINAANVVGGNDGTPARLVLELAPRSPDGTRELSALVNQDLVSPPRKLWEGKPTYNLAGPKSRDIAKPSDTQPTGTKPLIVVDPGHGGHDSGAVKHGTVEKNVVLAFGKVLRDHLLATGRYRVHMTRETDTFIPLGRRAEIAKQKNAALFISVHADYVPAKYGNVRGATVYTLRPGTARRLARRASPNGYVNAVAKQSADAGGAIKTILADFEKRWLSGQRKRTDLLARSLVSYMGDRTKLKPDPHRNANFRVLKSAQVPSALIELAYVSSKQDAALLRSKEWRQEVAGAIVEGVDRYFEAQLVRLPF